MSQFEIQPDLQSPVKYGPASVMDIVSFGFRTAFRNLGPLTRLSLPLIIPAGILNGIMQVLSLRMQNSHPSQQEALLIVGQIGIIVFPLIFLFLYIYYVNVIYVKDLILDEEAPSLYSYLKLDKRVLGFFMLWLLFILAGAVSGGLVLVGFILLVIPGLIALSGLVFLGIRFSLSFQAYILEPSQGVIGACKKSWHLTQNNFWRTLGLFAVSSIIMGLITIPLSFVAGILSVVLQAAPGALSLPVMLVSFSLLGIVSTWAQVVISNAGLTCIIFRYLFDLESRQAVPELDLPGLPKGTNW